MHLDPIVERPILALDERQVGQDRRRIQTAADFDKHPMNRHGCVESGQRRLLFNGVDNGQPNLRQVNR